MKIYSKKPLRLDGAVRLFILAAAASLLTACSSLDPHTRQSGTSLPIDVVPSGIGKVSSFRACETSERLWVAGSTKSRFLGPSAHVDVQLLNATGQIIAEEKDGIDAAHPRTARGRHGKQSFVASFPLNEAREAATIRVIYHHGSHSDASRS